MTNDELRAAERLRRLAAGDSAGAVYADRVNDQYRGHAVRAYEAEDRTLLSSAYLADRLADDGEAVTEEWLRGIGFVPGRMPGDLVLGPVARGVYRGTPRDGEWYWLVRTYQIPADARPATRGAVRRLFAALGIKVPA